MLRPLLLSLLFAPLASAQEIGEPARELKAGHWFNWIGDGPTIEGLRGRTVLVHFFLCEDPEKNGFQTLCKFHEDHADKGLVILAVSPDAPGSVSKLLEDYPLPFPVGSECADKAGWGIQKERGQVLIDPRGDVFFRAEAANAIWNGKLLKALKGSKRMGVQAHLAWRPKEEFSRRWASTLDDLAEGELAKALKNTERLLENEKTPEADRAEAQALADGIAAHVARLMTQIEAELERGEVLLARGALDALADELERHALGEPARARQAELMAQAGHGRELEAAKEYVDLITAYFTRGLEKNRAQFDKLMDEFAGTFAADKARAWVDLILSRRF